MREVKNPGVRGPADHGAFLTALHERLRNEGDPDVILAETTRRLALHLGASRTGYGEFDDDVTTFYPRDNWTDGTVVSIDDPIPFAAFGPAIVRSHSAGELWIHEDLDDPKLDDAGRATCLALGIVAVITVPVLKNGRLRSLISVQQNAPRRWFPEDIALIEELADRTWALLERARAEIALQRSREALFQSEKMTALGSLLAGVSHELNNPLSIIVAQAELLELEVADTPAAARAEKIRRAAQRSARIVQTFLAMARQKAPNRTVVHLNDVVSAALDLTIYGLRSNGILLEEQLVDALPRVMGDADQLHQVVVNLVINAQHAMQDSDGERRLMLTTGPADGGKRVMLEVADTGPGITPEVRRRIFEPFFTTKPQHLGTGVGLSLSQGIVDAHDGTLEVLPTRRGATFRMTLPAMEVPPAGEEDADARPSAISPPQADRRVLIVDDEVELADSLADIFTRLGFAASVAYGGRQAQAMLSERSFELVVTDLRMPDLDGAALFGWAVETRVSLRYGFAFMTGDILSPAAKALLAHPETRFLEKPFTLASVEAFVGDLH